MGGNSEFGAHGNSGIGGGYGSSFGNGASAPSSGATGGMGGNSESGSYCNCGIGGGYGSSSGVGPSLHPVTFNFNGVTQTLNLPNGDKIRMDKKCDGTRADGLYQNLVRIEMQGAGGSSPRGISRCINTSIHSCRNDFMVQGTEKRSEDITVMDLNSHVWALTAGTPCHCGTHHTPNLPVYQIENKDAMKPGCSYTFTWTWYQD